MDRLEIIAIVDGSTTKYEIEAEQLESLQIWDGGRFQALMRGGNYEGKPVTGIQMRQAEVVFAYMERKNV